MRRSRCPAPTGFLVRLNQLGRRYLVLTNNSIYTPRDLAARLRLSGLDVPEEAIYRASRIADSVADLIDDVD